MKNHILSIIDIPQMIAKNEYLKRFAVVSILAFLLMACGSDRQDVERLESENQELRDIIEQNQENVEGYFEELNKIENNLRRIKERENIITGRTDDPEFSLAQQDRINEDIQLIGDLLEENRALIGRLQNRLKNSETRISGFEMMIERLQQTIEEKEIEIQLLQTQLASMNIQVNMLTAKVDTLERERDAQTRQLQQKTLEMNRAFYAIGSRRELLDNNIISREGGFLGIGRTERVSGNLTDNFFTRIDITRDNEITIFGERPEVISIHPEDSYHIAKRDEETVLEIRDAEKFWSATRYLVIQIR